MPPISIHPHTDLTTYSYISSILGFKLSLLFSFYRIAIQKAHRIAIIVIMFACTAFHFCFLIVQINLCTPVRSNFIILMYVYLQHIGLQAMGSCSRWW